MKTFILCGGLGTRLRGVIGAAQKTVTAVSGAPFLWSVIESLVDAGLTDLVFCTYFQSEQVEAALASSPRRSHAAMAVVREPSPLGTGGALTNALASTGYVGPLVVVNGDTYLSSEGYATISRACAPAILVTPMDDCQRYGAVRVDDAGHVLGLIEKGIAGAGLINAGVYLLHTDHLNRHANVPLSIEKDVIPGLIASSSLSAVRYQGPFIDIGTPESLQHIRTVGVQGIQ